MDPLGMLLVTIGRQCDTRVGRYHQEQNRDASWHQSVSIFVQFSS